MTPDTHNPTHSRRKRLTLSTFDGLALFVLLMTLPALVATALITSMHNTPMWRLLLVSASLATLALGWVVGRLLTLSQHDVHHNARHISDGPHTLTLYGLSLEAQGHIQALVAERDWLRSGNCELCGVSVLDFELRSQHSHNPCHSTSCPLALRSFAPTPLPPPDTQDPS